LRPSGVERTLREWLSTSEFDPGCVETRKIEKQQE
jgi:hypothetical protein